MLGTRHAIEVAASRMGRSSRTDDVKNEEAAWEVDQDEHGNPLVRHRHAAVGIGARIVKDEDGSHIARCPSCGEKLEVPSRHE